MKFIIRACLAIISLKYNYSQKMVFEPKDDAKRAFYWVDGFGREPEQYTNTFFDRVVTILDYYGTPYATGVLISPSQVLTTLNPIEQEMIHRWYWVWKPDIHYLVSRHISNGNVDDYDTQSVKVDCARAVHPGRHDLHRTKDMEYAKPRLPYHDLLVLKMTRDAHFHGPPEPVLSFEGQQGWVKAGPVITEISRPGDELEYPLRFASSGHIDDLHINRTRFLEGQEFAEQDNIIANCKKLFPNEWGHFICIKNIHNYTGLASGAVLYSKDKLIGLGCFALWKGVDAFFVFTDLRKYRDLIYGACAPDEQYRVWFLQHTTLYPTSTEITSPGPTKRRRRKVAIRPDPEL